MREILFRGKRKDNGEWVEGNLIQSPYMGEVRSWISTPEDKTRLRAIATYYGDWRAVEVGTDTICQYTGLTDKNGNKIWENDVLEWTREDIVLVSSPYHEGYRLGDRVKVKKLDSGFTLLALKNNSEVPNVIGNVKNYEFWNMQRFLKVIGNIFDNANLLKGE